MNRFKSHGDERGQTTAEFVVVLVFLLLFFFLIIDFGWLLKNWIVVTNSAREAARCTVVDECQVDGAVVGAGTLIQNRIDAGITGNLTDTEYDIKYVDQNSDGHIRAGDTLVVCVRTKNHYITPTFQFFSLLGGSSLPNPLPIGAREEMRLELTPPSTSPIPVGGSRCFAT